MACRTRKCNTSRRATNPPKMHKGRAPPCRHCGATCLRRARRLRCRHLRLGRRRRHGCDGGRLAAQAPRAPRETQQAEQYGNDENASPHRPAPYAAPHNPRCALPSVLHKTTLRLEFVEFFHFGLQEFANSKTRFFFRFFLRGIFKRRWRAIRAELFHAPGRRHVFRRARFRGHGTVRHGGRGAKHSARRRRARGGAAPPRRPPGGPRVPRPLGSLRRDRRPHRPSTGGPRAGAADRSGAARALGAGGRPGQRTWGRSRTSDRRHLGRQSVEPVQPGSKLA
jgi:hypothetical protein